jgi:hypothetical protein
VSAVEKELANRSTNLATVAAAPDLAILEKSEEASCRDALGA